MVFDNSDFCFKVTIPLAIMRIVKVISSKLRLI